MIESPQSFVVSTECSKAAEQNGFRRRLGETDGWAAFQSTTAQGTIWLAAEGAPGPWYLALDHPGVIAEAGLATTAANGPGKARFRFESLRELYAVLPRIYALAASLPDAPLRVFEKKIEGLPRTTEAERLVVHRIGQDVFRSSLLEYWDGKCPLTGINDAALLRASHIIPWKDCASDAERLDVHNGLLLSALWDAAFDRGLVTFDDGGEPQYSSILGWSAREHLNWTTPIALTQSHIVRLAWHRRNVFVTG
ncbi:MAG: HNH endonuclease [Parvibaculaceae bacterium]